MDDIISLFHERNSFLCNCFNKWLLTYPSRYVINHITGQCTVQTFGCTPRFGRTTDCRITSWRVWIIFLCGIRWRISGAIRHQLVFLHLCKKKRKHTNYRKIYMYLTSSSILVPISRHGGHVTNIKNFNSERGCWIWFVYILIDIDRDTNSWKWLRRSGLPSRAINKNHVKCYLEKHVVVKNCDKKAKWWPRYQGHRTFESLYGHITDITTKWHIQVHYELEKV